MSDQKAFELFMSKPNKKLPENMTSTGNLNEFRIPTELKIIISVVSGFVLGYFIGLSMNEAP